MIRTTCDSRVLRFRTDAGPGKTQLVSASRRVRGVRNDLPTCSTGLGARLVWTLLELAGLLRRRKSGHDAR